MFLTKDEFRDYITPQDNFSIMDDCIILMDRGQLKNGDTITRLIMGMKVVVDIFEEYTGHFIDTINASILEGDI